MMARPGRVTVPKAVIWRLALLAFSSSLTVFGSWLNQQFDASRGPMRGSSPEVVVWISLAAVGLVLVLWVAAEVTAARTPRTRRSRGGRS